MSRADLEHGAAASRVAFIGLGIMGAAMAARLLAGGRRLVVNTRTRDRAAALLSAGAEWADTPAAATDRADVVLICVPDTPDVQAVVAGDAGVLSVARPGLIVVDHSTISPAVTRELARDLASRGAALLDAPVSGGDVGAREGTLSIMVGGDAPALQRVRPLLELMGRTITHVGPSGAGQLTKLVNQVLVSLTNLAVCEALTLARSAGLDPRATLAAVGAGAGGSWQLTHLGPRMLAGDFAPGFLVRLQHKDLRLVVEAADDLGLTLPGLELVRGLFERAIEQGRGEEGTQALFAVVGSASSPGGRSDSKGE